MWYRSSFAHCPWHLAWAKWALWGWFSETGFFLCRKTRTVFKSRLSLTLTAHFKTLPVFSKWTSVCKKAQIIMKGFWQSPGPHFYRLKNGSKKNSEHKFSQIFTQLLRTEKTALRCWLILFKEKLKFCSHVRVEASLFFDMSRMNLKCSPSITVVMQTHGSSVDIDS